MATPGFFDFHLHPTFKKFICQFEATYPTSRTVQELVGPFDLTNPLVHLFDDEFLHILGSQACVEQLDVGPLTLGVAAIAPIERFFTNKNDSGLFGKILNSGLTKPLDLTYMNRIREGQISYYQLFIREVNTYKFLQDQKRLRMLTRLSPNGLDTPAGMPTLVLGMEGGHGLCRTLVNRPGQADTSLTVTQGKADSLSNDFTHHFTNDPAQSLRQLQQALWEQKLDLCYLVLTHLSTIDQQLLATHAFGLKMIKDVSCFPIGNGITLKGLQVIDAAYGLTVLINKQTHPAPVLIDIKHMSLKSRLDFYAYRRKKNYTLPIVASHVGVTGYSVTGWQDALDEASLIKSPAGTGEPMAQINVHRKTAGVWGVLNRTFTYNAWSINLMDEDIEEVLNSDGLIGVSLDVRILGWQDSLSKGDKDEFMSAEEFRFFFPERFRQLSGSAPESEFLPTREERHPLALCFNILHIVSVGKIRTTQDPWKQICIGSDYDGLINPVINCRNVSQLPVLQENLIRWLPVAEKAYRDENGGSPLLVRDQQGEVDINQLKDIVQNLVFTNGERFLKRWITNFS